LNVKLETNPTSLQSVRSKSLGIRFRRLDHFDWKIDLARALSVITYDREVVGLMVEVERICANCSACKTSDHGICFCRRYGHRVARKGTCETIDVIEIRSI
jgi:hypothetical protein